MDWMFYLTVFVVLFSVFAVVLTIRHLIHRHLDKIEQKKLAKEEAQQIAESNSGL